MKILVSGSIAYDRIMEYSGRFSDHIMPEKIHALNLSFVANNFKERFGGTAGNIAYGLASLGENTELLSTVGKDFAPYKDWLAQSGVGLGYVRILPDKSTTVINILTDQASNQISAVCFGALADPCNIDEQKIEEGSFGIVSPGNIEDMKRLPKIYRKKKIPFIFDPGQQIPALSAENLRSGIDRAKILISNDYELALILKKTGWTEEEVLSRAEMIITTLGEKGSMVKTRERVFEIPPAKVKGIVDPTGAGDAYRAGLIKGIIQNWPIETAAKFAGVVAAYAVETLGTQEYKTNFEETCLRYKENFGAEPNT